MVHEEVLIFLAKDNILNSKSMYNRCQIPRLSVMVGEEDREPPQEAEFDTAELETELKKLKTSHNQRKADSVDNSQPFKKKKRWQFHYKWKRKRKEDIQSDQVMTESDSLKRPKRNDPDDTEEESPDPVPQTAEDEPSTANSISIPSTSNFFPIFSRKPLIFFKASPPKFTATTTSKEDKKPLKKKSKAKAKSLKTKTESETTNTITKYFGPAAANKSLDPP